MNATHSSAFIAEVPGYAELQREIHDALRAQHPEWIEADGRSPICESYELRFARLLVNHRNKERASMRGGMLRKEIWFSPNPRRAEIVLV